MDDTTIKQSPAAEAARRADGPPAIEIKDLRKRYGDVQALDGLTFTIERGEYFGLLGPNGAGKSTLINTIAGLVRPNEGSIRVLGFDHQADYRQARRLIGVIPQELVFDPFFSVEEVLRLQAGYYGCGPESKAWMEHLIQRLDLGFKRKASMRTLSGGQKRRVMLAQALIHKPKVVILDEPTAGVDVELRRTLWNFTRELHANGTTVVLTTHYLDEAQMLCERIAIIDHGRVRAIETTKQLLERHPFRFLRLTLPEGVELPGALSELVSQRFDDGVELKLERNKHPIGSVFASLRDAGVAIVDVSTREPNLEDIFLELTGGDGHG